MAKKKVKKLVVFILDKTGSMFAVRDETISGFNEYIQTLKNDDDGSMRFTLVQFNSCEITKTCENVKLNEVQELTLETYDPECSTPLYDVVGQTITELQSHLESKKNPPVVLFVIMTDGEENASSEYNQAAIRALVEQRQNDGWAFVFLAANLDAPAYAKSMNLDPSNAKTYDPDNPGAAYLAAAGATTTWSKSGGTRSSNLVSSD